MSVTDYADTPGGNATGIFPEGMARSGLNDAARVLQADIRTLANNLPFIDIGTGSGPAVYSFVSTNSFNVADTDVTRFYTVGRRVKIIGASLGTVTATIESASFNAPSTFVVVNVDNGVVLINESISVELSMLDPSGVPIASSGSSLPLVSNDAGAAAGPAIELFRDSASPADNDEMGEVAFTGRDSSGARVTYTRVHGEIVDATDGSERGRLVVSSDLALESTSAGAESGPLIRTTRDKSSPSSGDLIGGEQTFARNGNGELLLFAEREIAATDIADGLENTSIVWRVRRDGALFDALIMTGLSSTFLHPIRVSGENRPPLRVNRNGSSGTLLQFRVDDNGVGSVSVNAGGVVSYNTFTGSHWSEFDILEEADPPLGTLLSTADTWYDQARGLPKVRICKDAGCKRIYGIFGGRNPDEKCIHVYSLGTAPKVRCVGPIEAGDLLTASQVRGVAERQVDDVFRASTLGKALATDLRTPERLIAANIMAG